MQITSYLRAKLGLIVQEGRSLAFKAAVGTQTLVNWFKRSHEPLKPNKLEAYFEALRLQENKRYWDSIHIDSAGGIILYRGTKPPQRIP